MTMAASGRPRSDSLREYNQVIVRVWTVSSSGKEEIEHVSVEIPERSKYMSLRSEQSAESAPGSGPRHRLVPDFKEDMKLEGRLPEKTICLYGLSIGELIKKFRECSEAKDMELKDPISSAQASLERAGIRCSLPEYDPDLSPISPWWYLLFLRPPTYYRSTAAFPYGECYFPFELTIKNLQQAKTIEILVAPETKDWPLRHTDYPGEKDWIPDSQVITKFMSIRAHPIKMGIWSSLLGGGAMYAGNVTQWAFLGGFSPVGFTLLVMIGLGFLVGGFIQISQEGLPCESTCSFRPCFQAPLSPKESSQQQPIQEQEEMKLLLSSVPTSRNGLNTDLSIQ